MSTRRGGVAASVLWDLYKFYELIDLEALASRCIEQDFPKVIAQLCINTYKAMRFINIAGYIDGPYRAIRGVITGCSMAATFVRI
eukprot:3316179-Pyramimonas_sp.AAC.1